jgi:O-antigen ligase
LVGLLQNSAHIDLRLLLQPPGFAINEPVQNPGINGVLNPGINGVLAERFGARRAIGTSGHPIEFSVLAALAVPLTIHFARFARNRQLRLLALAASVVALLAMPAGVSRSGVVALAASLLIYIWGLKLRELANALAAGAVVFVVAAIALPHNLLALWNTITNSQEDLSVINRVARYARVAELFHGHPVFGIGIGGTPSAEYGPLDNEWLQALVQGGVVGLGAMIILVCGGIFGLAAALRGAKTRSERDQAYTVGAMFAGILASSFTFDLFSYQQVTLVFFILFGLLWSNFIISSPESEPGETADDATFSV